MTVAPPFNITESLPGDNDVVSQHPPNARTFRDVVESWLLTEHNVNGRHDQVRIDQHADASYPGVASVTSVWASSDDIGDLHKRHGTGNIEWVGMPPGSVVARFDASVPNGWTACDGTTLSRTVAGARLFALWGVTFGIGDGATTFNKPDCKGKVLIGVDTASVNVTGFATVGITAGANTHSITTPELAVHSHNPGTLSYDHQVTVTIDGWGTQGGPPNGSTSVTAGRMIVGSGIVENTEQLESLRSSNANQTFTLGGSTATPGGATANAGSGTAMSLVQLGIAVTWVIKL